MTHLLTLLTLLAALVAINGETAAIPAAVILLTITLVSIRQR